MCELLVGLPAVNVLAVDDEHGDMVVVRIESRSFAPPCPGCGGSVWVKDRPAVELVDLPCFGRPARLVWHKHRWRGPGATAQCGPGAAKTRGSRRLAGRSPTGLAAGCANRWAGSAAPSPRSPASLARALQRGRPRRALRRLGAAGAVRLRAARGVPHAALGDHGHAHAHALARRGDRAAQLRPTPPRRAARSRCPGGLLDADASQVF
jgi:hypothetical protein